ncbi:hypothetical protein FGKAn22_03710 [Ferrigenium kumadai]|uniref:DUF3489 domain-containing protein n=1 Tax=Ferrigenium kumadai TaxID=1682490 RepID=A0AAN1SXF8_9PROT|nr:DUF3489 domain-containing protein [Ferrigenium kumadai]BBI98678.1 hypothetical protein FGKAn22_03710 [Ferrigenium kumadai]
MTKAPSATKAAASKPGKQTQPAKNKAAKLEIPAFLASASSAPTKTKPATPRKKAPIVSEPPSSKQDRLIALMKQGKGSTITEMIEATGWQAHSIRGVISGVLKKRLSLNVISELASDGTRRYRIIKQAQA